LELPLNARTYRASQSAADYFKNVTGFQLWKRRCRPLEWSGNFSGETYAGIFPTGLISGQLGADDYSIAQTQLKNLACCAAAGIEVAGGLNRGQNKRIWLRAGNALFIDYEDDEII
jgi:hypothetical protein